MMYKLISLALIIPLVFGVFITSARAQDININLVDEDLLQKIKDSIPTIDTGLVPFPNTGSSLDVDTIESEVEKSFGGLWGAFDEWTRQVIGIGFAEIFHTVVAFALFIVKLAVKILRAILDALPFE